MTEFRPLQFEPEIPARFTIREFEQLCGSGVFDGYKVELVEGVIIRMSPAMSVHMALQKQLYDKLVGFFLGGRQGLLTYTEYSVLVGDATVRTIDVAVAGPLPKENVYPTADSVFLAIEISNSTLNYDLVEKQREYARAGIPAYWVVDPDARRVHVMNAPGGEGYERRQLVKFGQQIKVLGTDHYTIIEHPSDL